MRNEDVQHSRKIRRLNAGAKLVLLAALSLALSVGVNGVLFSSGLLRPVQFLEGDPISATFAHPGNSFGESR